MEPNYQEVANRIRALREDMGLTMQEMADATGRSLAEYQAQESGAEELSFTFLYKCAANLGVDPIELLTGETPHLTGYTLTRADEGLAVRRRSGLEYLHKAFSSRPITAPSCRTSPSTCPITAGRSLTTFWKAVCASSTRSTPRSSAPGTCCSMIPDVGTA